MSGKTEYFREVEGMATDPDRQVDKSHVFVFNPSSINGVWDEFLGQALSEVDQAPEDDFKNWFKNGSYDDKRAGSKVQFQLGNIQLTTVKAIPGVIAVNALVKTAVDDGEQVYRYWAASLALTQLYDRLLIAKEAGRAVEVHFQYTEDIDGSDWHVLKVLIEELADENGIFTTVNHKTE
jgi:hypothetical protein